MEHTRSHGSSCAIGKVSRRELPPLKVRNSKKKIQVPDKENVRIVYNN